MLFSAATEPGEHDKPNEDWVGMTPNAVVVLDGVTVQESFRGSCIHGTPWYVMKMGSKLIAEAADQNASLIDALRNAISSTTALHADTCQLDDIGAPSAAVAVLRINKNAIEYLVLADITVLIRSSHCISVITDERVNLFHPALASRICNTWMALASCPARQGQQRSFRRILHVLSWAFARSPGERSCA